MASNNFTMVEGSNEAYGIVLFSSLTPSHLACVLQQKGPKRVGALYLTCQLLKVHFKVMLSVKKSNDQAAKQLANVEEHRGKRRSKYAKRVFVEIKFSTSRFERNQALRNWLSKDRCFSSNSVSGARENSSPLERT
ncbi:hypothetical protein CKAN_02006300 [Cinnamomum micranthum f. kanehirae]|uniref:Uncharacterized protein n=1 Tax=Cinnamomum micranthum f. kanehirae TaxID=337451 RepID=A0A3S3NMZ7_9MAGN|nr:hypothetical protein CKAN_02006300 [Cinnamomum micranthum f. kanehirae]